MQNQHQEASAAWHCANKLASTNEKLSDLCWQSHIVIFANLLARQEKEALIFMTDDGSVLL